MTLPPNNPAKPKLSLVPAVESGEPSRAMDAVRHAIWRNVDSAANSPNPVLSH